MRISNYSVNKNPYRLIDVKDVHYTQRIYFYYLKSNRKDLDKKYIIYNKETDEIELTDDINLASIFEYRSVSFEDSLNTRIKKFGKAEWKLEYTDSMYSRNIYKRMDNNIHTY